MLHPGKSTMEEQRCQLLEKILEIIRPYKNVKEEDPALKTRIQKLRASVKSKIIIFLRNHSNQNYLSSISDLPFSVLFDLCENLKDMKDSDLKPMIQQIVGGVQKEKVLKNQPVAPEIQQRIILTTYLQSLDHWQQTPLEELLEPEKFTDPKKKKKISFSSLFPNDEDASFVFELLHKLLKEPPLPIPRYLVDSFLLESDFKPNTLGDPDVFIKQNGLKELEDQLKIHAGEDEETIMKHIRPLLFQLTERNRLNYKAKFLTLPQVRQMIQTYQKNPFKLHLIINQLVTHESKLKMLDMDLNFLSPQAKPLKINSKTSTTGNSSKLMLGDRPILYMMVRPWIRNWKATLLHNGPDFYKGEMVMKDEKGREWFLPTPKFYEDSCDPHAFQKGTVYHLLGQEMMLKYMLFDDRKEIIQNEEIFKLELQYFNGNPLYTVKFLESAYKKIQTSFLPSNFLAILKDQSLAILNSSLGKVLPVAQFETLKMAQVMLDSIFQHSVFVHDIFIHVFDIVHRLDPSICSSAVLHQLHHQRFRQCFYLLEPLYQLPDSLAFVEKFFVSDMDQKKLDSLKKEALDAFVENNYHRFLMTIYPFQRVISTRKYVMKEQKPLLMTYPTIPDSFLIFVEEKPFSLVNLANESFEGLDSVALQKTKPFYEWDHIYFKDNLKVFGYPDYYIVITDLPPSKPASPPTVATSELPSPTVDLLENFWPAMDKFISKQESLPVGKNAILIQATPTPRLDQDEEEEEELEQVEEEEDVEIKDYDFYDDDEEFIERQEEE